jgi:hypothetical protein
MSLPDRLVIEALDPLLRNPAMRARINLTVKLVERKLVHDSTTTMAWEPIPLSMYDQTLPDIIRSSWVFILRANATTGAERHPNSHQRTMAYRGEGDFQIWAGKGWQSNHLISDDSAPPERRWISVPANVWHQVVVPERDWVVVSFHTVAAADLIEERPDALQSGRMRRRRYHGS